MGKWESASAWNKMYACWLYVLESFPYYFNFLFTILTFTFLLLSSIVLTFTFFLDLFHFHSSCLFTLVSLSLSSCIFPVLFLLWLVTCDYLCRCWCGQRDNAFWCQMTAKRHNKVFPASKCGNCWGIHVKRAHFEHFYVSPKNYK